MLVNYKQVKNKSQKNRNTLKLIKLKHKYQKWDAVKAMLRRNFTDVDFIKN